MSAKEVEKEKEKRSKALRQDVGSQTSPAKRAAAPGAGAGSGEDEGSDGGGGVELEVRRELASMSYKNLRHMESGPKVRVSAFVLICFSKSRRVSASVVFGCFGDRIFARSKVWHWTLKLGRRLGGVACERPKVPTYAPLVLLDI